MKLIPAVQSAQSLLADIKSADDSGDQFHLWWLGQSGYLLKWKSTHALIDPYLSDSLTNKYAETDKPHVRMCERAVDPAQLDFIDFVTSSHNHTDHLDADTLKPLMRVNEDLQLVAPEANRHFASHRLACDPELPIGLDAAKSVEVVGIKISGIPAAHETIERDAEGRCHFLGYILQFGDWSIYHSGDTMLYPNIVQQLLPFEIDIAPVSYTHLTLPTIPTV